MVSVHDVRHEDGRVLRAYDTGGDAEIPVIVWHHGSPQSGVPLEPIVAAAAERGIRVVSYGRPSYGGSTPSPGRDVASAAWDVALIADTLGVRRFATMGASGGGPHALACGALLGERVTGVVCLAGIAPDAEGRDWLAGIKVPGGLGSAREGREARVRYAELGEWDDESFTPADWTALDGRWASLGADAGPAGRQWPDGLIDDDVASASPWGFELSDVTVPVLLVQGEDDRVIPPAHARWLADGCPRSELWLRPGDGHITVLDACPAAMDWLLASA